MVTKRKNTMIKKFSDVPEKIYVCEGDSVGLYIYQGTDMEEIIAPYLQTNYHIFVKDMGKPTVQRLECDTLQFTMNLHERDYFTTKRGCEKFLKEKRKQEVERIKKEILKLQNQLKEAESRL
jgi:hypothetical protein